MSEDFRERLSAADREAVEKTGRTLHFQPGEAVFHEGERYRGFFLVQEGACKVFRLSEEGKEAVLSFFLPGQAIALVPLLRNSDVYPASCLALQQSVLIRYDAVSFRALLKHRPSIQSTLQESMASIAEFFRDKTSMLMLEGAEERVTGFLRQIGADRKPTLLDVPKRQIALFLGITPEAFSRALASLKERGDVEEQNGLIRLLAD